jgi:hypothetical protein
MDQQEWSRPYFRGDSERTDNLHARASVRSAIGGMRLPTEWNNSGLAPPSIPSQSLALTPRPGSLARMGG